MILDPRTALQSRSIGAYLPKCPKSPSCRQSAHATPISRNDQLCSVSSGLLFSIPQNQIKGTTYRTSTSKRRTITRTYSKSALLSATTQSLTKEENNGEFEKKHTVSPPTSTRINHRPPPRLPMIRIYKFPIQPTIAAWLNP